MWLSNASWQITVAPQFKRYIIYVKHKINMNGNWKVFYFNCGKTSTYTHFSSLSPPKLICSTVWFVCQTKWQIRFYDWLDRLSIKLLAKGQFCMHSGSKSQFSWLNIPFNSKIHHIMEVKLVKMSIYIDSNRYHRWIVIIDPQNPPKNYSHFNKLGNMKLHHKYCRGSMAKNERERENNVLEL